MEPSPRSVRRAQELAEAEARGEDIWRTAKGRRIPISKITDGHLVNALAWSERELSKTVEWLHEAERKGWHPLSWEWELVREVNRKLENLLDRERMLVAERDRRWCVYHEDCLECLELARACAQSKKGVAA